MTTVDCKAKDPETCRYHGKFNKQYDKWVEDHNGVEPNVVFQNYSIHKLPVTDEPLGFEKDINGHHFFFAAEQDPKIYGLQDTTVSVEGQDTESLLYSIGKELHPSNSKNPELTDERKNHLRKLSQVLKDGGMKEIKRRDKALRKGFDANFVNNWDISTSLVSQTYEYGTKVDALNNLKDEEKAIILARTLMKHESLIDYPYGTDDFHDTVKGVWSIYKTYGKAITKK
jgi:hypothetical protein